MATWMSFYKFLQKVEYDNLPVFCCHCKMQGHNDKNCRILHPELSEGQRGGRDNESTRADPSSNCKIELAKNFRRDTLPTNEKGQNNGQKPQAKASLTKSMDTQLESDPQTVTSADGWKTVTRKKGNVAKPKLNNTKNEKCNGVGGVMDENINIHTGTQKCGGSNLQHY